MTITIYALDRVSVSWTKNQRKFLSMSCIADIDFLSTSITQVLSVKS